MARNDEEGGFKQAVVEFPEAEKRFLKHHEVCRVATSHNDTPHVTPVNFVFDDGFFYFATDYDTKKYRNLAKNKKSALVVDVYNSSVDNKAVIVQGVVEFVEEERNSKSSTVSFMKSLTGLEKSRGRKEMRRS